ncbi:MAG: hypothetical protein AAF621_06995, partial [Pseudomonadota bacterium]
TAVNSVITPLLTKGIKKSLDTNNLIKLIPAIGCASVVTNIVIEAAGSVLGKILPQNTQNEAVRPPHQQASPDVEVGPGQADVSEEQRKSNRNKAMIAAAGVTISSLIKLGLLVNALKNGRNISTALSMSTSILRSLISFIGYAKNLMSEGSDKRKPETIVQAFMRGAVAGTVANLLMHGTRRMPGLDEMTRNLPGYVAPLIGALPSIVLTRTALNIFSRGLEYFFGEKEAAPQDGSQNSDITEARSNRCLEGMRGLYRRVFGRKEQDETSATEMSNLLPQAS